jgi:hypothetical protein
MRQPDDSDAVNAAMPIHKRESRMVVLGNGFSQGNFSTRAEANLAHYQNGRNATIPKIPRFPDEKIASPQVFFRSFRMVK